MKKFKTISIRKNSISPYKKTFKLNEPSPYKHTTCISRWNDLKTIISASFERGIHVVCVHGISHSYKLFNSNL